MSGGGGRESVQLLISSTMAVGLPTPVPIAGVSLAGYISGLDISLAVIPRLWKGSRVPRYRLVLCAPVP